MHVDLCLKGHHSRSVTLAFSCIMMIATVSNYTGRPPKGFFIQLYPLYSIHLSSSLPLLLFPPSSPFLGKPKDSVSQVKRERQIGRTKRETDILTKIGTGRETDRERSRQTDRETDRYTARLTGSGTGRETDRYTDCETDHSILTTEEKQNIVQSASIPRSTVTTSSNQRSLWRATTPGRGAGPQGSAGSVLTPCSAVMVTKEQLMLDLVQSEVGWTLTSPYVCLFWN